jgi:hypothetical protein
MPRFFFDVHHKSKQYVDHIGEDLPDRTFAWGMATTSAGEAIRDLGGRLRPNDEWRLDVNDENGRLLYRISVTARRPA